MVSDRSEPVRGNAFIGRRQELAALTDAFRRGDTIIQVNGPSGIGKTSLVNAFEKQLPGDADWVNVTRFHGSRSFELSEAIQTITNDFKKTKGPHLLIVDDADLLDQSDLIETIRRLETGPWPFSTVLVSSILLPMGGTTIQLSAFSLSEFSSYMQTLFGNILNDNSVRDLYEATKGNPLIARLLRNAWQHGRLTPVELTKLLTPFERPGLVDRYGRPLTDDSAASKKIIVDVRGVNDEFLRRAADDPNLVFGISPRQFEELVAELLSRLGYRIELTPQTRDGGKDIYAAKHDNIGNFLYIVECKRYAPDSPVGVEIVRALHGVADIERVTGAMIVTTSYFSADARALQSRIKYQMSLKEYFDLRQWLSAVRPK
jgi:restriction system protein